MPIETFSSKIPTMSTEHPTLVCMFRTGGGSIANRTSMQQLQDLTMHLVVIQPFSQKSLTATVPKVFQIGLCGVIEADLELFCNSGVRDFWENGCRWPFWRGILGSVRGADAQPWYVVRRSSRTRRAYTEACSTTGTARHATLAALASLCCNQSQIRTGLERLRGALPVGQASAASGR